jgi:hypothetical protein
MKRIAPAKATPLTKADTSDVDPEIAALLEEEALLKQELKLKEGLPHLYGWKWYPWARRFFESTNRLNFLCAANQISKSSTQIRKCIDWATNKKKWPLLWRRRPRQFWYLYPSKDVATIEFKKKWLPEFMPQGEFASDAEYGFKAEYKNGFIVACHFNSGVSVYFKTYAQDVQHLQTGTVDAIFCDEELPEEHVDELMFRLSATDGYFHMVFTATLGQEIWRCTMEEVGNKDEKYIGALKLQISMYDCLEYDDGTPSDWTPERIQQRINMCKNHAEVQRRVFGKFVVDSGLKYGSFDRKRNFRPFKHIPEGWHIYAGVDIGSGGEDAHPSAIAFIAVRPDYREGVVFKGWRGDGIDTTAGDVVSKFITMKAELDRAITAQYYDWQNKDFFNIASSMNEPFLKAEKGHDIGEWTINVLFKNQMLWIAEDIPELQKLATELATVKKATPKTKAKDDFIDGVRYGITQIPWDFSCITGEKPRDWKEPEPELSEAERRRQYYESPPESEEESIEDELEFWQEQSEV